MKHRTITHYSRNKLSEFYPTPCGLALNIPRNHPLKLTDSPLSVTCRRCREYLERARLRAVMGEKV